MTESDLSSCLILNVFLHSFDVTTLLGFAGLLPPHQHAEWIHWGQMGNQQSSQTSGLLWRSRLSFWCWVSTKRISLEILFVLTVFWEKIENLRNFDNFEKKTVFWEPHIAGQGCQSWVEVCEPLSSRSLPLQGGHSFSCTATVRVLAVCLFKDTSLCPTCHARAWQQFQAVSLTFKLEIYGFALLVFETSFGLSSGSFRLSWVILVLALKHGICLCPLLSVVALPDLSCSSNSLCSFTSVRWKLVEQTGLSNNFKLLGSAFHPDSLRLYHRNLILSFFILQLLWK